MTTKNFAALATVALALAGASVTAFAADTGLTREQVRAELARARVDGTLVPNSESYGYAAPVVAGSSRTRAEVRAEAIEAAKTHKSDASYGALSTGY